MISTRLRTGFTCLGILVLFGLLFSPVIFPTATDDQLPTVASSTTPATPPKKPFFHQHSKSPKYYSAQSQNRSYKRADHRTTPTLQTGKAEEKGANKAGAAADAKAVAKKTPEPKPQRSTLVKSDLQSRLPADVKELAQLETQVENVAERVLPAVVGVQVGGANGSAVIISKDGLVLSAAHVCGEPGRPVTFLFANGKRASGITLGVNKSVDGGMMKITTPGEWPYAPMGDSDKLALGDWVIALGHPNGYSSRRPPVVRLGRLLGRDSMPATLRTDCVLVGGDSGGPMFDLNGLVIGIHSRIGDGATNNLHVPVETFWKEWDRLTVGESWGIAFWQRPNNNNNNRSNDPPAPILGVAWDASPKGLKVARLSSNRPAEKAGIQVGDILKKFDGKAVSTEAQFTEALRKCKANQEVTLEFERQDKPLSIKVKLDPFPTSPGQKKQEKK